ncbi:MAG: hypothetical protein ITG02_09665 [Patulibacter sp.]|nr:hypothetical protein [Patulibacter sp.]
MEIVAHKVVAALQSLGQQHPNDKDRFKEPRTRTATNVRATLLDIPGDVRHRVQAREIPDPMWFAGRVGPSGYDVARADTAEFTALTELCQEFEKRHSDASRAFRSRRSELRPRAGEHENH